MDRIFVVVAYNLDKDVRKDVVSIRTYAESEKEALEESRKIISRENYEVVSVG